jgi:hypothetical protein
MKIFLETKEDRENFEKFCEKYDGLEEDLKLNSIISNEEESFAVVSWALEDFDDKFPEHASKEAKIKGIRKIEKILREGMIQDGWNTIEEVRCLGLHDFIEENDCNLQ